MWSNTNTNICYSNNIQILFEYRIIHSPLVVEHLSQKMWLPSTCNPKIWPKMWLGVKKWSSFLPNYVNSLKIFSFLTIQQLKVKICAEPNFPVVILSLLTGRFKCLKSIEPRRSEQFGWDCEPEVWQRFGTWIFVKILKMKLCQDLEAILELVPQYKSIWV